MKIIFDIINLKKSLKNLESDFTLSKAVDWYSYVLEKCLIIVEYKGDELQGFIEWVRLKEIPKDVKNIRLDYDVITTAPVVFIINVVAKNVKVYKSLLKKVRKRNKNRIYSVWFRSKDGRMRVMKNRRINA